MITMIWHKESLTCKPSSFFYGKLKSNYQLKSWARDKTEIKSQILRIRNSFLDYFYYLPIHFNKLDEFFVLYKSQVI